MYLRNIHTKPSYYSSAVSFLALDAFAGVLAPASNSSTFVVNSAFCASNSTILASFSFTCAFKDEYSLLKSAKETGSPFLMTSPDSSSI